MIIEKLLKDEIQNEFEKLKTMENGTDKYQATIDGVTKLIDRLIEFERLEADIHDKSENRETNNDFNWKQFQAEKKDRLIKNTISIAGIVLPVAVTIWGTLRSLKFEETGTVTTIMGRGFINKLLPKGK